MKISPLFDRVLVVPIEKEKTTKSGIVISQEDDREIANLGKVVAVGFGQTVEGKETKLFLKENQVVLFEEHMAAKLVVENTPYYLLRQVDVLAVLEEE